MRERRNEDASGPAVQKRELFLVASLIASWVVVVYFLVHSSKADTPFQAPRRNSIRVEKQELTPAILKRYPDAPVEEPVSVFEQPLLHLAPGAVGAILRSMKVRSHQGLDSSTMLITAEPMPAPMVSGNTSIFQEEVIGKIDQETVAPEEASGQEGELLEPEAPELVEPPAAPAAEPIKS